MKRMSSSLRAKEEFMVLCREGMYQAGQRLPSETKMALPDQLAVLLYDLDLTVPAADLAIVALGIQPGGADVHFCAPICHFPGQNGPGLRFQGVNICRCGRRWGGSGPLALLLQVGLYPGFMTGYEGVDPGLG